MPILNQEKVKSFLDENLEQSKALPLADFSPVEAESDEGELAVDVFEDGDNYYIQALMAAIKANDLEIAYGDLLLTIRGSRSLEQECRGKNYLFQECSWGRFSRSIVLPAAINAAGIEATLKNGILTVILPKI